MGTSMLVIKKEMATAFAQPFGGDLINLSTGPSLTWTYLYKGHGSALQQFADPCEQRDHVAHNLAISTLIFRL